MKQIIRLTESDLHRIVKETVNRVLNEGYSMPDFVITSIIVNGEDVSNEFFNNFGNRFESKYAFSPRLNQFLKKYGITAYDVDTANDFGEDGDEIYINTNSNDDIEVHGGYEDIIGSLDDDIEL